MSVIYCSSHGLWDSDDDRHCPTCMDLPIKADVPWTVYLPVMVAGVCVGEHELDVMLIIDTDGDLEEIEIKGEGGQTRRIGKTGRPDAHSDAIWHAVTGDMRCQSSGLRHSVDKAISTAIAEANF